jgi:hypothetical protein
VFLQILAAKQGIFIMRGTNNPLSGGISSLVKLNAFIYAGKITPPAAMLFVHLMLMPLNSHEHFFWT